MHGKSFFNQFVLVRFHGCPMQKDFLLMECKLSKEEFFFDKVNWNVLFQGRMMVEQLMGKY